MPSIPVLPAPPALDASKDARLDELVMRALSSSCDDRFATAEEMARAIEDRVPLATARQVGEWVEQLAAESLASRSRVIASVETSNHVLDAPTLVEVPRARAAGNEPAPRRARVWVAFLAGLLVALGVMWALRSPERPTAPLAAPAVSSPSPPVASPIGSPLATVSVAPVVTYAPAATTPKKAPPPRPSAAGKCVVKSYVDSAGVKHYFNDCPK